MAQSSVVVQKPPGGTPVGARVDGGVVGAGVGLRLPPFFEIFVFREAAAAGAARAAIAKMENFMVVVVGCIVVLLIIIDQRELQLLCLLPIFSCESNAIKAWAEL